MGSRGLTRPRRSGMCRQQPRTLSCAWWRGFPRWALVEALQAEGRRVRVFDRLPRRVSASIGGGLEWYEGDFGNRGDTAAAVEGCEVVFHLAATTPPKTSNDDPVHDLESNLLPTVRFLDLARKYRVRRIVFSSSGGTVYGVPHTIPIPEGRATQPICSYGIHKLAIEQYLHLYHLLHGVEYCVLRLANPFGERQRTDAFQGAVSVFLDKALRGEEITVGGDGSIVRDYVYVGDVARAFCDAARPGAATGIFNIGSGRRQSVEELLAAIEGLLGRPVARRYVEGRPFDVPINVLDIALARRVLGWQPRVAFAEGLQRTLDWLCLSRSGGRSDLVQDRHAATAGEPGGATGAPQNS
jgi:UDP-glucose 4-epimerase